jgi:large subunit ribosomal protein L30
MPKIKITQVVSAIDCKKNQKLNLVALGFRKTNQAVIHEATPQILGMVHRVKHLVKVENV